MYPNYYEIWMNFIYGKDNNQTTCIAILLGFSYYVIMVQIRTCHVVSELLEKIISLKMDITYDKWNFLPEVEWDKECVREKNEER